ncbi:hypothetical protein PLESTM_000915600 [Pleodorina starrii]|nr:hypothetical protein PLESTM_000915600 [Pleodorina starrii]
MTLGLAFGRGSQQEARLTFRTAAAAAAMQGYGFRSWEANRCAILGAVWIRAASRPPARPHALAAHVLRSRGSRCRVARALRCVVRRGAVEGSPAQKQGRVAMWGRGRALLGGAVVHRWWLGIIWSN